MTTATSRNATANQITIDYDRSRLVIKNLSTKRRDYKNISGALETVEVGTVMGIVSATQKMVPMQSDAIDGSQIPVTVVMDKLEDIAIDGTVDQVLTVLGGDIRRDKLVFQNGTDTLATTATDAGGVVKTLEDWLIQNCKDIELVTVKDNSEFDN